MRAAKQKDRPFEEIMAKNFPNFMKNINLHIQEDKYWQAYGENETLAHCWRDCKIKIV